MWVIYDTDFESFPGMVQRMGESLGSSWKVSRACSVNHHYALWNSHLRSIGSFRKPIEVIHLGVVELPAVTFFFFVEAVWWKRFEASLHTLHFVLLRGTLLLSLLRLGWGPVSPFSLLCILFLGTETPMARVSEEEPNLIDRFLVLTFLKAFYGPCHESIVVIASFIRWNPPWRRKWIEKWGYRHEFLFDT